MPFSIVGLDVLLQESVLGASFASIVVVYSGEALLEKVDSLMRPLREGETDG